MRILEINDETAMEYMRQWINQEDWDDFQVMYNYGDPELFAYALVNAGAINSEMCYENCKPIEQYIEKLAENFNQLSPAAQRKRYDAMLKEVITIDCQDCNHVSFVADHNEVIYPELLKECWACRKTNIKVSYPKSAIFKTATLRDVQKDPVLKFIYENGSE